MWNFMIYRCSLVDKIGFCKEILSIIVQQLPGALIDAIL